VYVLFQPCYQASAPRQGLLPVTALTVEIVHALNNFYDDFLERCIRDNHDYVNQMDVNDGEFNKQNVTKVYVRDFRDYVINVLISTFFLLRSRCLDSLE
jgi:hypothetical protein